MPQPNLNEENLLNAMVACLTTASGAASQLIHQKQDVRWIVIRESVESVKDIITKVAGVQAMATLRNSQ